MYYSFHINKRQDIRQLSETYILSIINVIVPLLNNVELVQVPVISLFYDLLPLLAALIKPVRVQLYGMNDISYCHVYLFYIIGIQCITYELLLCILL